MAQSKAAKLLLDRGVRLTIPDAPILDRLLRRNVIHIRPLKGGTILECAILMLDNELDEVLTATELHTKLDVIAEIIAVAILNDEEAIANQREELTRKLLWKYSAKGMIDLFRHFEPLNEIEDFMNITNFFASQTRRMTARKVGQRKGS